MLRPGHWSLHIGNIGQGGPFDVPNVSGLRCGHRGERLGLDAEAKKQFWIVIVSGSALQIDERCRQLGALEPVFRVD